jgi:hypothetical protein
MDRAGSARDPHDAHHAVGQTRHFAALAADEVRMLGAVIATLSSSELEAPQAPDVRPEDEPDADEIDQIAVHGRGMVTEVGKHPHQLSVGQRRAGRLELCQHGHSWARPPEPGVAKGPAPLGGRSSPVP